MKNYTKDKSVIKRDKSVSIKKKLIKQYFFSINSKV